MRELSPLQLKLHEIIFEADSTSGKYFDVVLIVLILGSVCAVVLESIGSIRNNYGTWLTAAEWAFTIIFTIEYILRLYCIGQPWRYARSFFGIIDLLAVLPAYLSLIFVGSQALAVVRILRVLRVFRVLKFMQYVREMNDLRRALYASRRKIFVFMATVTMIAVIVGALMYLIEGEEHGHTSIPVGIYWAVVTMTTVGYGDVSPQTPLGQSLATLLMILGYGIIAVPTGIVTSEITTRRFGLNPQQSVVESCPQCALEVHNPHAIYCHRCGAKLNPNQESV